MRTTFAWCETCQEEVEIIDMGFDKVDTVDTDDREHLDHDFSGGFDDRRSIIRI